MSERHISEIADINPPLNKVPRATDLVSFVTMSGVSESGGIRDSSSVPFGSVCNGFTRFQENDTLFAKITPCMENGKGALAKDLIGRIGCGSTEFHVLRPKSGNNAGYLYHLMQWQNTRQTAELFMSGSAGQQRVQSAFFHKHVVYAPDPAAQSRITAVLDCIDTAIEQTEALIEKYQHIKAGLMHDLFTRGVLPSGQLRPPRDQAPELYQETTIGWIPKEWQLWELDRACRTIVDCPHSTPIFLLGGVLVARTMHIKNGVFLEDEASRVSEWEYRERIARSEPMPGDVILTREAPVGEAFVIPCGMKICLGQRVMLIKPNAALLDSDYLVAQIYSGALSARIAELTAGTTNPHLNVADVRCLMLAIPPFQEQQELTRSIKCMNARIRTEQNIIQKLQTKKLGLMQDLLTGKVAVNPHESEAAV